VIQQDLEIKNRLGLHARPAALIAQTASGFNCEISLAKDGVSVNAKSIMGVMMLAAEYGSTLQITTNGNDEQNAFDAIKTLFENKFNEDF